MKKFMTILALLALTFTTDARATANKVYVDVNGLVCDFCSRALEKVFSRQEEVEDIDVDLNIKVITITLKEDQKLSNAVITQLINDAGYSVVKIRDHQ